MSFSTRRTVRERALLLATVTLFATASAFVVLKYKFLPSVAEEVVIVPSIAFGLLAALSFDRMVGTSIHLLRVARLGTKEEKHAVMKGSPAFGDAPVQALVAIELGDFSAAKLLLAQDDRPRQMTPQHELAEMRYAIVTTPGVPRRALLERALAWRATHGGLYGLELERYRAFIVAQALLEAPVEGVMAGARARLTASGDEHVRGYGAWLTEGAADAADLSIGAALARHHGRHELASDLAFWASRAAGSSSTTPYRSGGNTA